MCNKNYVTIFILITHKLNIRITYIYNFQLNNKNKIVRKNNLI